MKKTLLLLAGIAAMACSCDKAPECGSGRKEGAALSVSLDFEDDTPTRASAYVASQTYETAVNKVQVLVFDSSGALNSYVDAGAKTSDISIGTTSGNKTVWAVVNGPDLKSIKTLSALQSKAVDLGDNSTMNASGFVMAGSAAVTVGSGTAAASISVRRFAARVALAKVTNSLPTSYGALTVNSITLINVAGNQNLAGDAAVSTWYNKMGRKDGATSSGHIIDGSTHAASHPDLTFRSAGNSVANGATLSPGTPYLFYTFPNPSTADASGWAASYTPRKTRLVVSATIGGTKYHYPITIDSPKRNTSYTVELTITGLGSTDPDKPVEKGSITASVSVEGWASGAVYSETL
jgi:hypothetical protein